MATSTIQSTPETVKDIAKKSRSVKRTVKAGRPVGAKKRGKKAESMTSQLFRQGKDAVSGAYETAAKAGRAMPKMPSSRELRQQGHTVYTMMEERNKRDRLPRFEVCGARTGAVVVSCRTNK